MRLRVPRRQVKNVFPALGLGLVEVGIRLRERTEELAVLAFEVKSKRGIEGVTGLVPQDAHALGIGAAFHFKHLLPFELYQARVREVKRDRDPRHAVW